MGNSSSVNWLIDLFGGLWRKPLCFKELSKKQLKGLILAQNERWRRGLGMQVERET